MSEGQHWYYEDGTPCFELPNKSKPGQMRGVTIADAKKLGLLPSVNTIASDVLAKSDLNKSGQKRLTAWCYDNPPRDGERKEYYHERADCGAFAEWRAKRDLGTAIHKALEQHFQGLAFDAALTVHVEAVDKWVKENEIVFVEHELRLVNKAHGYAGTTDAAIQHRGKVGILDFKSTSSTPGDKIKGWPDQPMQISAYAAAYAPNSPLIGCNVYISTTEPGRVEAVWYDEKKLAAEWEIFQAVLQIWRARKQYDPRRKE